MKAKTITISLLSLFFLFFQGCQTQVDSIPVKIAFSKGSPDTSYANYYNWIRSVDSTVICQDMYAMPLDSALKLFKGCSGLLLTGGTDIYPGLYGKAYDTADGLPVTHRRDPH